MPVDASKSGGGADGGQLLRTALHTVSKTVCKSHTWKLASWKALRDLNARRTLPIYPVSEDEKSNWSDEKSVKWKVAEKTNKTNIIATNFLWEQSNIV